MVNDQEPRYRLVDSNSNIVGSLFQNADGNVEIQDETGTGSVFGPDGIVTPAIDAGSVSTEDARVENSSCLIGLGSNQTIQNNTFTIVEFSDTSGDRHNQIGFDTTNNKYVASDEQTVSIFANLCWDNEVNGQIRLQFLKNGNAIPGGRLVENGTDGPAESILSYRNVKLQENDELEVQTRQRHGDVRDLRSGDNDAETYVAIRRL